MATPKLRFKEFDGDWYIKKLGDVSYKPQYGMNSSATEFDGENKYLRITDINEDDHSFDFSKLTSPDDALEDKYLLKSGDLLFARTGASVGKSYLYNQKDGKVYFAGFLIKFSLKDFVNPYFIFSQSLSQKFQNWVITNSMRSGQPGINAEEYSTLPLALTSLEEQTKIASFLSAVDEKISQLTQKHELLSQYKQGMMQKLFSQQIRFKADDGSEFGEWVQKTIGKIGEIITGKTPSTNNPNAWNGDILFVTPTDMNGNKYQTSTIRTVENSHPKILPKNAIMFTCIASIGKMSLSVKPCITNQQINSVVVKKDHPEFIYYQLLNMVDYIKSTQANTTLPIINKTEFSKFILKIPQYAEQTKIANFLSSIDQKIEVVAQQIEHAKQWKKGLLQQMFV